MSQIPGCDVPPADQVTTRPPVGLIALSGFFAFGATMASTTCLALLFPANAWAGMWRLNPEAHAAFQSMGFWAIVLMFSVATACAISAIGLWIRARSGHRLAIAILLVNMVGDVGNAIVRDDLRTLIGIPIAALMIGYLLTPGIRRKFVAMKLASPRASYTRSRAVFAIPVTPHG